MRRKSPRIGYKETQVKIDLHIHSTASDGSDTPEQIVERAARSGMEAIALTDHDSVGGLSRAREACRGTNVALVDGIELSTYSTTEIHILGYGIDPQNANLLERLETFAQMRRERAAEILAKLRAYRIELDASQLDGLPNVGRMHIAKMLVSAGYCANVPEAFDRYLGQNGCVYCPSKRIIPSHGVQLIRDAGGVAVIAHPMRLLTSNRLQDLIDGLRPYGLEGLEVYYPSHDAKTADRLARIAQHNRLWMTGGSDYHGENRGNIEMGCVRWSPDKALKKRLSI